MPPPSPVRSARYLAFVREQRCWFCQTDQDIQAHHHGRRQGGGGVGMKGCDLFTVPLCQEHHREWHQRASIGERSTVETELEMWKAMAVTLRAHRVAEREGSWA
jgi:hypothetical protein